MIQVTPKAVEQILAVFAKEGVSGGLRMGVAAGGCSGLSYVLRFEAAPRENDQVYEFGEVKVFVDPRSHIFLDGVTLDYMESAQATGFCFLNPKAGAGCGCGSSFTA